MDIGHPTAPRAWRAAWWTIVTALTLVGAAGGWLALGTAGALGLVGLIAALVTLGCWQRRPEQARSHPSGPEIMWGLLGGMAGVAVIGLMAEFGPVGWCLAVLVAAVCWGMVRHPAGIPAPGRPRTPDGSCLTTPPGPPIERVPSAPLQDAPALSTPQLCWAWRVSYVRLQRWPYTSALNNLAELRAGYLDELEHRDPAAFARWFPTARAASDPARFFCTYPAGPGAASSKAAGGTSPAVRPPTEPRTTVSGPGTDASRHGRRGATAC